MNNKNKLYIFISALFVIHFFFISEISYSKIIELRFSWWGGNSRIQATLSAINLYMKKNPNVKIVPEYSSFEGYYQKCLSQLAGGTAPDIMQLDQPWLFNFIALGNLFADLYQYRSIVKLEGFDKKILNDMCIVNNKLVGLPTGLNASTYIVNKEFLKKYNINFETEWNWENLLKLGIRIHKQDSSVYLIDASQILIWDMLKSYIENQSGKPFILNDYEIGFDKKMATDAFIYYHKLLETGTLLPFEDSFPFDNVPFTNLKWLDGKIGMSAGWASVYPEYQKSKFELGVTLPATSRNSKNTGIIVRPSQVLALNNKSDNLKEAAKFINWFFNDPEAIVILKTERGVPATENGRKILTENKIMNKNVTIAVNLGIRYAGLPEHPLTYSSELTDIFKDAIQQIAFNRLSPEQAAENFINRFQIKLTQIKNRN